MAFYAVKSGRREGIYTDWNDCLEQVKGYSGAEYKKFKTETEAKEYLGIDLPDFMDTIEVIPDLFDEVEESHETIMFYVDGSYNAATGMVGYGVIGVVNNEPFIRDFGSSTPVEDTSSRNVLGEIKGAIKATELAIANGYKEITICYDYEGVEKWATNQWKTKNPLTQYYKAIMSERMKHVKVRFNKIKSHSGDKWNDEADRLAKLGANV